MAKLEDESRGGREQTQEENGVSSGIQDWGEEIWGARKNALKEIARKLGNVTVDELVAQPLGKLFKGADWKGMADKGELTIEDAIMLEAITRMILRDGKPKPLSRNGYARKRREAEIRQWAEKTAKYIDALRNVCDASTADERKSALAEIDLRDMDAIKEKRDRMLEMNPGRTDGGLYPPSEAEVMMEVLKGLGYPTNEVGKAKFASVDTDWSGSSYEVSLGGKYYGRYATQEEAVAACLKISKVSRGDTDVAYTPEDMSVKGKVKSTSGSGKWSVFEMGKRGIDTLVSGLTKEEAGQKLKELQEKNPRKEYAIHEGSEYDMGYKAVVATR